MIDEGSCWPEIAHIQNKYVEERATIVDDIWFARYPRHLYYIHDNGGEFIGSGFTELSEVGRESKNRIRLSSSSFIAHHLFFSCFHRHQNYYFLLFYVAIKECIVVSS